MFEPHPYIFTENAVLLISELLKVHPRVLSKEDIRQDVLFDDDAKDGSIRQLVSDTRRQIKEAKLPYQIHTVQKKGYYITFNDQDGNVLLSDRHLYRFNCKQVLDILAQIDHADICSD